MTNLLKLLDMNVIMTAHETVKWQNGKEVGRTFDGYKKSNHFFDLMLKLERRGRERVAIVEKTRIAGFPDGSTFPATYAEFAVRYGAEAMERAAESVALVAPEDATRIRQPAKRLMKSARVEKPAIEAALAKAGASKIDDLSDEHAAKLEAWLESKRAVETEEQPVEA